MARQNLNDSNETHGSIRVKINENFIELYGAMGDEMGGFAPWDSTKAYKVGNIFRYDGKNYSTIADSLAGQHPPLPSKFELVTPYKNDNDIKTAYENNADTNAFTDADKTKLNNAITSHLTPSEIKTKYESNSDTNAFTNAEKTKLSNALTAHLTPSEIKAKYESNSDTNAFNNAYKDQLDNAGNMMSMNFVSLTQAEYDALSTKDDNTIYDITDA